MSKIPNFNQKFHHLRPNLLFPNRQSIFCIRNDFYRFHIQYKRYKWAGRMTHIWLSSLQSIFTASILDNRCKNRHLHLHPTSSHHYWPWEYYQNWPQLLSYIVVTSSYRRHIHGRSIVCLFYPTNMILLLWPTNQSWFVRMNTVSSLLTWLKQGKNGWKHEKKCPNTT